MQQIQSKNLGVATLRVAVLPFTRRIQLRAFQVPLCGMVSARPVLRLGSAKASVPDRPNRLPFDRLRDQRRGSAGTLLLQTRRSN
jgi:hypothetical protein